jgi:hypothetical protein
LPESNPDKRIKVEKKKTPSLMHLPDRNPDRSDQGIVEDRLTHMITPQIKDRFRWPGLLKYAKTRKSDGKGGVHHINLQRSLIDRTINRFASVSQLFWVCGRDTRNVSGSNPRAGQFN